MDMIWLVCDSKENWQLDVGGGEKEHYLTFGCSSKRVDDDGLGPFCQKNISAIFLFPYFARSSVLVRNVA